MRRVGMPPGIGWGWVIGGLPAHPLLRFFRPTPIAHASSRFAGGHDVRVAFKQVSGAPQWWSRSPETVRCQTNRSTLFGGPQPRPSLTHMMIVRDLGIIPEPGLRLHCM